MAASPPDSAEGYRADVDGLRALAVLAVVAFHAGLPGVSGGFAGVDLFFVISGFLITRLLVNELERSARIDFRTFYARRVRRLLPTLLLLMVASLAVAATVLSAALGEVQAVAKAAAASLLLSANIFFYRGELDYFGNSSDLQPLLHIWSLSVEEQFYLVWPLVVLFTYRLARSRERFGRWLTAVLVVTTLVSLLLASWLQHRAPMAAFYLMPPRAWELGAGALLAVASARGLRLPHHLALPVSLAGLGLFLGFVLLGRRGAAFPFPGALAPVLGGVLLILGGGGDRPHLVGRALASPPLVFVGKVSYSWYLWHWPLLVLPKLLLAGEPPALVVAAAVGVSFVLAVGTTQGLENPVRFSRRLRLPEGRTLVVGMVASLAVAAAGMATGWRARTAPRSAAEQRVAELNADRSPDQERCLVNARVWAPGRTPADCLAPDGVPRLLLWGDSYADQWAPMAQEWARRRGMKVERWTMTSCQPYSGATPELMTGERLTECTAFNRLALDRLRRAAAAPGSAVVLGGAWTLARDVVPEGQSAGSGLPLDQAAEGPLQRTLEHITRSGLKALVLLAVPHHHFNVPACLMRRGEAHCQLKEAEHEARYGRMHAMLRRVTARFPGARTVDPARFLCIGGLCQPTLRGTVVYHDNSHLSATMARRSVDLIESDLAWLTGAPVPAGRAGDGR